MSACFIEMYIVVAMWFSWDKHRDIVIRTLLSSQYDLPLLNIVLIIAVKHDLDISSTDR